LAEHLGIAFAYEPDEEFGMLGGRVARLRLGGEPVGVLGEVHPDVLAAFDLAQAVTLFELDLPALLAELPERRGIEAVSRFPAVEQDLALVVDEGVAAGALEATIEASRLVAEARVFDVYRGDQLPAGKKSIAFAIRYQAPDRTLTTEDANREQARIVQRIEREFGAEVRA
jgi:phenylalanyl-tRNA synthetase beta chain